VSLLVDCPQCGRKTEFAPTNRWRPFCSERCKQIDMGVWASGGYTIAGDPIDPVGDAYGRGPSERAIPRRN
jgi:hypothetical protein